MGRGSCPVPLCPAPRCGLSRRGSFRQASLRCLTCRAALIENRSAGQAPSLPLSWVPWSLAICAGRAALGSERLACCARCAPAWWASASGWPRRRACSWWPCGGSRTCRGSPAGTARWGAGWLSGRSAVPLPFIFPRVIQLHSQAHVHACRAVFCRLLLPALPALLSIAGLWLWLCSNFICLSLNASSLNT